MKSCDIVIVGAGISGLTAAYYLKQAGHRVKILEANKTPGGRMITIHWQGFQIDPGASFLTSRDQFIFKLIDELGIQDQVASFRKEAVGFRVEIMRNNQQHNVNFMSLVSYLQWSGVSFGARLSLVKLLPHLWMYRNVDPYHPEFVQGEDNASMEEFFKKRVSQEMFDYWVQPTMDVMCSYLPGDFSEKMLLLTYVNYLSTKTISFKTGIGFLTQLLADQLDVEYEAPVTRIEYVQGRQGAQVHYRAAGGEQRLDADFVVVSVPGDNVLGLFENPEPAWKTFFPNVHYTKSAKLFMQLEGENPALDRGGCFFPRNEPWKVAVLGWERQPDGRIRGMGALKADYYRPELSDEEFKDMIIKEAIRFEPAFEGHIKDTLVFRWNHKVPTFRPGYVNALKVFKEAPQENPVYFCGDYLIMGSAGSAMASGLQCVERIAKSVNQGERNNGKV
jgi:oxygen-dependent protoporphyrinogen oxidase